MITSRLEAFSDGVFAIAFTLLVLEFHPPAPNVPLTGYLSSLWPSFLAYSISFLLIGLVWANHHSMFVHIRRVDRPLLFLNTMLLADVAFLPFPTQLLAQALRLRADLSTAAFVYGLVLTIGGLFFNGIWLYAIRHPSLMSEKTPERYLHQVKRRFLIGPASYGLATVFALVAPAVSVVCYAILIVYFWLPPRGETSATSG
jgi:uncharacterized membrane protein